MECRELENPRIGVMYMEGDKQFIKYFHDLDVYQIVFKLSKVVIQIALVE